MMPGLPPCAGCDKARSSDWAASLFVSRAIQTGLNPVWMYVADEGVRQQHAGNSPAAISTTPMRLFGTIIARVILRGVL